MNQQISELHALDGAGLPAGGATTGTGIQINWQNGPLGRDSDRKEPNGAFVEGVIAAAAGRIEFYQTTSGGRFACAENALALTKLREALAVLDERTQRRSRAGTEGTHAPDVAPVSDTEPPSVDAPELELGEDDSEGDES